MTAVVRLAVLHEGEREPPAWTIDIHAELYGK